MLFDDVEELDAVGPWEVLASWAKSHPDEAEVVAFAREAGPIRAAKGLRLLAEHGLSDVGPLDVLLHPGGSAPARCSRTTPTWRGSASSAPASRC